MANSNNVSSGLGIAASLLSIIDKCVDAGKAAAIAKKAKEQIEKDHRRKTRLNRVIFRYQEALKERDNKIAYLEEKLAKK